MSTHHQQIVSVATEHGWTLRTVTAGWIDLRREPIDLTFAFRKDGQISSGSREDATARPGYRFTDHILKGTKNRVGVALGWIMEQPPSGAVADLDVTRSQEGERQ